MHLFLSDVESAYSALQGASSGEQGVDYSHNLISITAVEPLLERFNPFEILDTEGGRMVMGDESQTRVVEKYEGLNVSRVLHQSTDTTLQSMSDRICVS